MPGATRAAVALDNWEFCWFLKIPQSSCGNIRADGFQQSQNLKIWCRLMRNVSLKRMEVKRVCCSRCFRWKSLQNHQEMPWCCGKTLLQGEERIRGDENGQDVGGQGLVISSDWSKVNGAGFPSKDGFPFLRASQEEVSYLIMFSLRIYKGIWWLD